MRINKSINSKKKMSKYRNNLTASYRVTNALDDYSPDPHPQQAGGSNPPLSSKEASFIAHFLDEHYETEIFDMFTLVDGTPRRVIVCSERVYYKLCADYRILHYGSGGAAYNYCSLYHYNDAEIFLDYGVVMNGENYYEIYQARENIFNDRLPDDHPISREEYFAKADALEAETTALDLTPLSLTL